VHGQINSDTLHRHLVSALPPNSSLFVILDCCHSGSALELPWVYKADEYGNINLMDNVRAGIALVGEAQSLIQEGFTFQKLGTARHLLAGANDFFKGLKHQFTEDDDEEGVQEADGFAEDWDREQKSAFMFSGCKDEQTSAGEFLCGFSTRKRRKPSRTSCRKVMKAR
jgi:metacaspase-1